MRRIEPINLTQFQGGLNFRGNEFTLADNESPDMLNVEVDPRAGVATRKGWDRWNSVDITADPWNPRMAFVHELASGVDVMLVTNNNKVLHSIDGSFSELSDAGGVVAPAAGSHQADFAPWGDDVFIVGGNNTNVRRWDGQAALATDIPQVDTSLDWVDSYTEPTADAKFVRGTFVASHGGRMWVAGTSEQGETYPYRVRWSHPNNPTRWASYDFVDILEGGGPITAIVPLDDHLLVFKQSSVWAIYGFDGETQQIINVSRQVGAYSRECVAVAENAVYFVAWPQGVFRIAQGQLDEISRPLRPMIGSTDFNSSATDFMWLGWLDQRLWWAAPYLEDGVPSEATSVFVFDPSLGSWTMFRAANGFGLGPFAQGGHGQGSFDQFGFCRSTPQAVRVGALDEANDNLTGTAEGFASRYTTRWLHGGWPELKKRWVRPTFLAQEYDQDYRLQVSVFAEYQKTPKRKFGVNVSRGTGIVRYDDGRNYDDGNLYNDTVEGTVLRRTVSLGSSPSVQLKIEGEVGKAWGLDGIVLKFKPRKFR